MNDAPNKDSRILRVFKYCKNSFGKHNINIDFPKNTNPKNTYKWRYLNNFVDKVDELKLNDDFVEILIDTIADYAHKNKQLKRGLSLLTSNATMEQCLKIIESKDYNSDNRILKTIKLNNEFINNSDLLYRKSGRGLPNIVIWFLNNKISVYYLSISKKSHDAMMKLNKIERGMLPSGAELINARSICKNKNIWNKIKAILKDDLRTSL